MAFCIDARNIAALSDYASALKYFDQRKPFRDSCFRPLERHSHKKKHLWMDKGVDGSIRCGLYNTQLVEFMPDGRTRVHVGYRSISTDNVIHAILRHTPVQVWVNRGRPTVWTGLSYNADCTGQVATGSDAWFDKEWKLTNPDKIKLRKLNVKKANAVKKSLRYSEFTAWRKAYEAMTAQKQPSVWATPSKYRRNHLSHDDVVQLLQNGPGSSWVKLAAECSNEHILMRIYESQPDVIDVTYIDAFRCVRDWENALTLDRKYYWAV